MLGRRCVPWGSGSDGARKSACIIRYSYGFAPAVAGDEEKEEKREVLDA